MNEPLPCQECGKEIYFDGICYNCRTKKKREYYLSLSSVEMKHIIKEIISEIETIGKCDKVYKDFYGLLAYQNIDTEKIADAAFQKSVFYPPSLYRNASPVIRDRLIEMLIMDDCEHANHFLQCLAMCGGHEVCKEFYKLENNSLAWRKKLHVDPSIYAECGGWSFDAQGNHLNLNFPACYAMLHGSADDTAIIGKPREEHCSHCGCRIVDILTLDSSEERLAFLGLKGKIRIPICPNCASMCEKTIVRYRENGESTFEIMEPFGDENYMNEDAISEFWSNTLALTKDAVSPFYACGSDEAVTIGGMANWIQDWQYEICPDCGKKMKYIAGISWGILMDGYEGTLFIEICTDCCIISVFHQQT